jgi:hypothetical protein
MVDSTKLQNGSLSLVDLTKLKMAAFLLMLTYIQDAEVPIILLLIIYSKVIYTNKL